MIHDLLIIARMLIDLLTGGDPTVPSNHPELWPLARELARIHDLIWSLREGK